MLASLCWPSAEATALCWARGRGQGSRDLPGAGDGGTRWILLLLLELGVGEREIVLGKEMSPAPQGTCRFWPPALSDLQKSNPR